MNKELTIKQIEELKRDFENDLDILANRFVENLKLQDLKITYQLFNSDRGVEFVKFQVKLEI